MLGLSTSSASRAIRRAASISVSRSSSLCSSGISASPAATTRAISFSPLSLQAQAVQEATSNRRGEGEPVEGPSKLQVLLSLDDRPGALTEALQIFAASGINLTHIESRPHKTTKGKVEFQVDFEGSDPRDPKVASVLSALSGSGKGKASFVAPKVVPWFPTRASDIDHFSTKTLDAGAELESDHPGFKDAEYRERRRRIVANAATYRHGQAIPRVAYTDAETKTWGVVYDKLRELTSRFACDSFNAVMPQMEKHCGYARDNIPQLEDISTFLQAQTGFSLRPVSGLLSARDFLNGLAFRVFFSTQYLRHSATPLYTPEPDICHELLGHAPMFADKDFADFSHEIGLASLGASDEDIKKLATCYWFSVEFGLCKEKGEKKAYGAGLLSSFGELEYSCAPYRPAGGEQAFPEYRPWDPSKAAVQPYPITKYQPVYYVAESLKDAKEKMREYCENQVNRGFHVIWDPATKSVGVDRAIVRGQYAPTLQV